MNLDNLKQQGKKTIRGRQNRRTIATHFLSCQGNGLPVRPLSSTLLQDVTQMACQPITDQFDRISGRFKQADTIHNYVWPESVTPLRRPRHQLAPFTRQTTRRYGGGCERIRTGRRNRGRRQSAGTSTLNHDIPDNFSARPKRFLRLAIQFGPDSTGIAERHNELVLRFPLPLFTGA